MSRDDEICFGMVQRRCRSLEGICVGAVRLALTYSRHRSFVRSAGSAGGVNMSLGQALRQTSKQRNENWFRKQLGKVRQGQLHATFKLQQERWPRSEGSVRGISPEQELLSALVDSYREVTTDSLTLADSTPFFLGLPIRNSLD